jgi:hypothetical protein
MTPDTDPNLTPRLERLLRANASRMPTGLSDRVFDASVGMLPDVRSASGVIGRLSWRWVAAAAALLLTCGIALRLAGSASPSDGSESLLTVVIDSTGGEGFGEDVGSIAAVRGGGFDDLDQEMRLLLADGRLDG